MTLVFSAMEHRPTKFILNIVALKGKTVLVAQTTAENLKLSRESSQNTAEKFAERQAEKVNLWVMSYIHENTLQLPKNKESQLYGAI